MKRVELRKAGVLDTNAECVVNAANKWLQAGGGVCGVIFNAAGYDKLQKECNIIGGCETGNAVITKGYDLDAKYIIHAVGPVWSGGKNNEGELLYNAYKNSLLLARDSGIKSIAFPLISSGIFGYPIDGAWNQALKACSDFFTENPDLHMHVVFTIIDDNVLNIGIKKYNGGTYE